MTVDGHGKHFALIALGRVLRRSLCGYSVVPHPDGEPSMNEWDERCCADCSAIGGALTGAGRRASMF